jgi:hypothetical protein
MMYFTSYFFTIILFLMHSDAFYITAEALRCVFISQLLFVMCLFQHVAYNTVSVPLPPSLKCSEEL